MVLRGRKFGLKKKAMFVAFPSHSSMLSWCCDIPSPHEYDSFTQTNKVEVEETRNVLDDYSENFHRYQRHTCK